MNQEYKEQIKEAKSDIKMYKVILLILCIIILVGLVVAIILNKTGVISDNAMPYVSLGAFSAFFCGCENAYSDIQRSNEKITDLQQKEIEALEEKLAEKEGE